MKNFLLFCGLLLSLFSASFAHADLTEQQRIADAEQLVNLYNHNYAPFPWKEEFLGITRDQIANELLEKSANANSDEEFYDAVARYLGSLHDAHVSWTIPSGRLAFLGFDADDFAGEVLIVKSWLPNEVFPFEPGDRILRFDGKDVDDALQDLMPYTGTGSINANRRFAAGYLVIRPQERIPILPSGVVTLEIYSQARKRAESISLRWLYQGFPLAEANEPRVLMAKAQAVSGKDPWAQPAQLSHARTTLHYIEKPLFPLWPSFEQRDTDPFLSGTFTSNGKRIGFIRIHSWTVDQKSTLALFEKEIAYMNAHTDALVLDQSNNPGGDACLTEKVAGFFIHEPKPAVLDRYKPTRSWLRELETMYESFKKDAKTDPDGSGTRFLYLKQIHAMRTALQEGAELTEPFSLCRVDDKIFPHKTASGETLTYQHPVLLTVDELSCSCGDLFPTILQDSGAATIFGNQTMGCGGTLFHQEHLGYSDLKVAVTTTMGVRNTPFVLPDGSTTYYMENTGVKPDVPYQINANDFRNNYESYRQAIEKAVLDLIAKTPASS